MLGNSETLDSMHGHRLTIVNLGERSVVTIEGGGNDVHVVTVAGKSRCKAFGKTSCTIDVWRKSVTANHDG